MSANPWPNFMDPLGLAEAHREQWRYHLGISRAYPAGTEQYRHHATKAKRHRAFEKEQRQLAAEGRKP